MIKRMTKAVVKGVEVWEARVLVPVNRGSSLVREAPEQADRTLIVIRKQLKEVPGSDPAQDLLKMAAHHTQHRRDRNPGPHCGMLVIPLKTRTSTLSWMLWNAKPRPQSKRGYGAVRNRP